jgi:hypothetical protein
MGKFMVPWRALAPVDRPNSKRSVIRKCQEKTSEGNLMKSVAALCSVIFVCSLHEAKAQAKALPAVDFSTMTCEQFWEKTTPNDRGPFLFWLSGYFGHKNNSPVLDPVGFTEKTKALSQYCSKQPSDSILSAAEKAFTN